MINSRDYLRLNANNLHDIPSLLFEVLEKAGVYLENLEICVKYYDDISNSHGCPVNGVINWGGMIENAPRNYPGWRGNFKAFAKSYSAESYLYLTDYIKTYVTGLNFSAGCPGKVNEYFANIGFYFFSDDFPEISKNLKKHELLSSFTEKNKINKSFHELNFVKEYKSTTNHKETYASR